MMSRVPGPAEGEVEVCIIRETNCMYYKSCDIAG